MLPKIGDMCLFCQEKLLILDIYTTNDKYIHYRCPKKCCKVMTESSSGNWILFRIYLDQPNFFSIEIDKRQGEYFLYRDHMRKNEVRLPIFDITPYSLLELKNKIKKYLLFS
jgi:hypothetical protein